MRYKIELLDAQITDPSDELYDLQKKYNVKISRSNQSDAVYIFKTKSYKVRVGHPMSKEQQRKHLHNYAKDIWVNNVTKKIVESTIKKYFK